VFASTGSQHLPKNGTTAASEYLSVSSVTLYLRSLTALSSAVSSAHVSNSSFCHFALRAFTALWYLFQGIIHW